MSYHQGRLFDHIHLRVRDYDRAATFYLAIFDALGWADRVHAGRDWMELDELYIDAASDQQRPSRIHLCFQASDGDAVQRFYEAGLANGGQDNGAPGPRDYHPGYFAAYLTDPDGNNIEAKFDERATRRSAGSVEIETG